MYKTIMTNGETTRNYDGRAMVPKSESRREAGGSHEYIVLHPTAGEYKELADDDGDIWLEQMGDGRLYDRDHDERWREIRQENVDDDGEFTDCGVIGYSL